MVTALDRPAYDRLMGRPRRALALTLLACSLFGAACANNAADAQPSRAVEFVCQNDTHFTAEYERGAVRITTPAGSWRLAERPSSIGRRFASDTAAFIHDEDRAALNGLPGGPFRRCREAAGGGGS